MLEISLKNKFLSQNLETESKLNFPGFKTYLHRYLVSFEAIHQSKYSVELSLHHSLSRKLESKKTRKLFTQNQTQGFALLLSIQ